MLGVFAQFETAIRKERQMEGIARAKAAGIPARGDGKCAMPDNKPKLTDEKRRRYVEALEALPPLTRTVFVLASRDGFRRLGNFGRMTCVVCGRPIGFKGVDTWKTDLARSMPTVLTSSMDASCSGASTPPLWHIDAVRGRPLQRIWGAWRSHIAAGLLSFSAKIADLPASADQRCRCSNAGRFVAKALAC